MADITQIQSDSSNGTLNSQVQAATYSYVPGPLPTSAEQMAQDNAGAGVGLEFPGDNPKYYFQIELADYNRTSLYAAQQVNFAGGGTSIKLPIPLQLRNHLVERWNTKPLGLLGTLAAQGVAAFAAGNKVGGAAQFAGAATAGLLLNRLGGATSQGGAGAVSDSIQAGLALGGVAISRFVIVTYEGPEYKRHSFTWKLVPRNPREAESIRQIVRALNDAATPTLAFGGVIFGFPQMARMSFHPNPKYLYKFKPAVITSVMADYASGGQPAFLRADQQTDGLNAPEAVMLNLQLIELEYWIRGNHNDTNDPNDVYNQTPATGAIGAAEQGLENTFRSFGVNFGQGATNTTPDLTK
jgi:hypothetical protein